MTKYNNPFSDVGVNLLKMETSLRRHLTNLKEIKSKLALLNGKKTILKLGDNKFELISISCLDTFINNESLSYLLELKPYFETKQDFIIAALLDEIPTEIDIPSFKIGSKITFYVEEKKLSRTYYGKTNDNDRNIFLCCKLRE